MNVTKRALRILQLNSLLTGGGTDDRSVRIAHAIQQLGHFVLMLGPPGREFTHIADQVGLALAPTTTGLLKSRLILSTARLVRRHHIQILHARHGRDYWPAIFAGQLSGVRPKIVFSRHLARSPSSWVSRRFLLSQCDAMLAVSEFVAKVLREGHSDPYSDNPERHYRPPMHGDLSKIKVVYGGIDTNRFKPAINSAQRKAWGIGPDEFVFAVVGVYDAPRGKGQPEFLEAAAKIRSALPGARFLIIGRGNMHMALEQQINRLGLQGVAQLTGWCTDMPAAMNAIDCLVLPAVGTEAMPGVVLEAYACGKPVIASELDGIPEAFNVASYGQLVRPGSVEELAAAMLAWAKKPALDMSARWQLHEKVVAQFSLERAAERLVAVYESLLNPAVHPRVQ